ncbi:MAG: choice-of-anchor V domain-containing protein [Salibacteraceae bacterium]
MKRILSTLAFASTALLLLNSYSGQAPTSGHTGSPGDNNSTCASSSCHIGSATPVSGMITTNIPSAGYEAGKTYDITFSISESGRSKFGFQVTSEDASGNKKGKFQATTATQIQNNGTHITHKSTSTSGTDSKTWTVQWIAPAVGSGDVTFYGAGNATNGRGDRTGDLIKTSNLTVQESITSSLIENAINSIRVFPNPAKNSISIEGINNAEFTIVNLNGQTVLSGLTGSGSIDISELNTGIYFFQVPSAGFGQKLIKD